LFFVLFCLIKFAVQEKAILAVFKADTPFEKQVNLGIKEVQGEIVDPKCFFGVMNPAEGKIHKSCAIRCISGGIPAIIRSNKGKEEEYYIIKGINDKDIRQSILPYIGEEVRLTGSITEINNWKYITVSDSLDIRRLSFRRWLGNDSSSLLCMDDK